MTERPRFQRVGDRLVGELDERKAQASRALNYHHTFLDDYFRAILPHDLILLGAPTGIGKTDLALSIAAANARSEYRAHYFALEAEPRELERRLKYSMLVQELVSVRHPRRADMNYTDWYLGRLEDLCGPVNAKVDKRLASELETLFTFYRGQKFDAEDLTRAILEVHDESDLILVDHLHYVDADDAEDDNRAVTDLIKTLRDITLRIGKPCLCVAHLRKRDERVHKLMPTLGDFHGSSNLVKVCTQIVTLERAHDVEPTKWWFSPTYMAILKDRRAGAPHYVALLNFNLMTKVYSDDYTLGRASGRKWEEVKQGSAPSWARGHRPLTKDGEPSPQAQLAIANVPGDDVPHAVTDNRFK